MIRHVRRRGVQTVAAWFVAAVFLSLPTLWYAHDRITAADDGWHFRPGKNIERPHEPQSSVPAADLDASASRFVLSRGAIVVTLVVVGRRFAPGPSAAPRAPPAL